MPVTLTATYTPNEHTPVGFANVRFGISPIGTPLSSGSGLGGVGNLRRNDFYNTFDTDQEYTNASPTDSNLIDPIVGFYYEGNGPFSSITLEIKGDISDSGWTVLFNHHNNFFLRRRDAQRFYNSSDNITKWVWTRLGGYYTEAEQLVMKSFFEVEYQTFSNVADLKMSFANEDIITPELKTIFRSLQYDSDITGTRSNFELTNLQPKFPGEATGFRWDLENTRIYAKQLGTDAFLKTLPHPGLPDVGPKVKNATNCRVYWPIDYPLNISDENQFNCLGYIHGKVPPTTASYDNWRAKIVGKKVRSYDGSFRATITEATFAVSTIEELALDLDANGSIDALTDGLMFLRYLFNLRGEALIAGAIASNAFRTTAAEIEAYIADERVQQILDFDGNNSTDALTDGLMMLRYAFNLRDDALTTGAVSSDSPFSDEEVAQRVDEAFQTMITLNNDFTVFDGGASGGGDASAGTRLTYTVDSDSLRERPSSYSQDGRGHALFLEQAEDTVPHTIRNDEGTYGGNSSFRFAWLGNFDENANKIIEAESFLRNDPMGIIEPKDNFGTAYSADLLPSVENRQHDFIDNRARFVLQGLAGPTQEVVHTGSEPPTATLDLSPYGQLVSWKIERLPDLIPSGNGYTIESQENCTVLVRQDNIKAIGGSLFLSVEPGFGGETYAARVRIRYPNGGDVLYNLSGNVRGPHKSDSVTFNFPNANGSSSAENVVFVNDYSPALEGRDGIRLNLVLNTDIDEEDQEKYLGQLVSITPLQVSGGELVTLAGPLKKTRADETNISFYQNSTYFIPDGTSDTWYFQAFFSVLFQSPTSSATFLRNFRAVSNGTWKKDFGIEVLNPDGGTRLNTNTSPLRFVGRADGNAPRTELQENQQPTSQPTYIPSGPSKTGWFHYITVVSTGRFTTRTDNRIEVYWQGTLVSQHTFTGDPDNTTLFKVDFATGNRYDRGNFEESMGSNKFYRVTETRSTTQFFFTYGDAPISLNGDNSPDTDFLVFNNRSDSQVGTQKEAGAYDISPSNWLKQDGTRQNGEQEFYLDHKYSLQILKVN